MDSLLSLNNTMPAKPFSLRGVFPRFNFRNSKHKSQKLYKEEHSEKAVELNDSIIYAKRIQEGMMLKEKHLDRLFPESFIVFKPKDVVSGDFYWFTKVGNKVIVAVADCTGHGIPGAFMSVLGISLLNQIVIEEKNTDVSQILQRLDHKLKKAFSYSSDANEEQKHHDGMDIVICAIDQEEKKVCYAGAFRPLYHLSGNKLSKLEGSRYPIGGMHLETKRNFESGNFGFSEGDRLYLSTDGFSDQFGGKLNKKFMTKKFQDTLIETSSMPMKLQQIEMEKIFSKWKDNNEQTDDVLVIGLQL
ncbi:MAG: serine/threonine-protein phosphatase [Bacteroidota bacterium]|nr:serine/threonine-protein phosphatase [Bacteroidota bacterium]